MGLFGRLFGGKRDGEQEESREDTDRAAQFHRVADQPMVSAEQEQRSRDLMESEMDASRKKREADSAAGEEKTE